VKDPSAMIVLPPEEMVRLKAEAENYTLPAVMHCLDVLQTALERLRGGSNRRVEMEMALLKLCDPSLDTGVAALNRRMNAIEQALKDSASVTLSAPPKEAAPAPIPAPVAQEQPAPQPQEKPMEAASEPPAATPAPTPAATPATEGDTPFDKWEEVLSELLTTAPPLHGVLVGSTACLRNDFVLISTENTMFRTLISGDGNKKKLVDAIEKVTGRVYRIGMKKTAAPAEKPAEDDSPLSAFLRESRENGIAVDMKEEP